MRGIITGIIVVAILFNTTGCSTQNKTENNSQVKNSETNVVAEKESKILEVKVNLNESGKKGANSINVLQEEAKSSLSNGTKNAFNIDLKKGQSLKISTESEAPITVMLKNNSNEKYVYNKTEKPKDNSIIINPVDEDGKYELMVDFNEIEVFNFDVFIINAD